MVSRKTTKNLWSKILRITWSNQPLFVLLCARLPFCKVLFCFFFLGVLHKTSFFATSLTKSIFQYIPRQWNHGPLSSWGLSSQVAPIHGLDYSPITYCSSRSFHFMSIFIELYLRYKSHPGGIDLVNLSDLPVHTITADTIPYKTTPWI